jgi:hypothetical protein
MKGAVHGTRPGLQLTLVSSSSCGGRGNEGKGDGGGGILLERSKGGGVVKSKGKSRISPS